MKILVLTPYLPHRRVGHGGGTSVRDLLTWLARRHEVQTAALIRPGEEGLIDEVEELGVTVAPIPFLDNHASGRDRMTLLTDRSRAWSRSLRSGYPFYVEKYWSPEISRQVLAVARRFAPHAVQIEYLQLALLARDLRRQRDHGSAGAPRLILNTHELGSIPRDRRADRTTNPLAARALRREARAWRRLQVDAASWADRTLCVTPEDHDLYAKMGGRNLLTVPLGMDLERITADWDPGPDHRCLFVGSFNHRPNRLAAEFLIDAMWPTIRQALPESRLIIAGPGSRTFLNRRKSAAAWADMGIEALGFVDDLAELFRDCHLFLAPLPEGGGIKIKILEAMARGIPVITTPVGAEGITDTRDDAVVIAPFGDAFTTAVLDAARDQEACRNRALRARRIIEDRFSWAAIVERLTSVYAGD